MDVRSHCSPRKPVDEPRDGKVLRYTCIKVMKAAGIQDGVSSLFSVLCIYGSSRKNGNTEILARYVADKFKHKGVNVEVLCL
ncbi:MAG: NAD(P)H-dependent oxidoreductase, partial [Candidatus Baldrarchaeia archaeon]